MDTKPIIGSDTNTLPVTSFSEYLDKKESVAGPDNLEWKITIHDHKEYLKRTGKLVSTDPEQIFTFRYRPAQYFEEIHGIARHYTWICLYLNDIPTHKHFTGNIPKLYLPDLSVVLELYQTFKSNLAFKKKMINSKKIIDNYGSI